MIFVKRKIPIICFPKGIKEKYKDFNNLVKPDGINIDYDINPIWAKENLKDVVLQGGLNPNILLRTERRSLKERLYTFKLLKTFLIFLIWVMAYFQKQILID